jgi:endonuclease YncB( thermonuclease family)
MSSAQNPRGGVLSRAVVAGLICCSGSAWRTTAWANDECANPPVSGSARHDIGSHARIAAVDERLELTLEDGRRLKIVGVDPPRPTPDDPELDVKSAERLAAWLNGKDIAFRVFSAAPDRWGRLPAEVFAPADASGSGMLPVARAVIEAGLARFEPSAAARPCRSFLLAAEAAARAAALGLWADPYYAIIAAGDRASFPEKAGTSVIVEGRVANVEQKGFRTTLFFGDRRGWDFSVTILQRNIKIFGAAGLDAANFKGQSIRVRGLLDMRFGPQIEVSSPDQIETIAQRNETAASNPASRR